MRSPAFSDVIEVVQDHADNEGVPVWDIICQIQAHFDPDIDALAKELANEIILDFETEH